MAMIKLHRCSCKGLFMHAVANFIITILFSLQSVVYYTFLYQKLHFQLTELQ